MFINDILDVISFQIGIYADDTTIFAPVLMLSLVISTRSNW